MGEFSDVEVEPNALPLGEFIATQMQTLADDLDLALENEDWGPVAEARVAIGRAIRKLRMGGWQ